MTLLWAATTSEAYEYVGGRRSASTTERAMFGYSSAEDCLFGASSVLDFLPEKPEDKTQGVKNVKNEGRRKGRRNEPKPKRPAFVPKTTDL